MPNPSHIYAVILAGGQGTRFWPASRKENPKQFLPMIGDQSLLQETVRRILPLVPAENVLIVTNAGYRTRIRRQLQSFKVPPRNILLEPSPKNTAPAIAWAAARIAQRDPDGVMIVLPSDHLIREEKLFRELLKDAIALAQDKFLVTLGIVPSRPETGYGYLKTRAAVHRGRKICQVAEFKEKPDLALAKRYVRDKKYLWNSGMFIWRADILLAACDRYLPDVAAAFRKDVAAAAVKAFWSKLPSVSIDYGILEKASGVVTIPAGGIDWSDLGSWEALSEIQPYDNAGNQVPDGVLAVDCRGLMVRRDATGRRCPRLIAAAGLEDIIIVDTDDALLVCRKQESQKVKDIVEALKKAGREDVL